MNVVKILHTHFILGCDCGPSLEKVIHTAGPTTLNGPHQRRGPIEGLCVHRSPCFHQQFDDVKLSGMAGVV